MVAGAMAIGLAGSQAFAATPAVTGCVGETISAAAQGGAAYGHEVSGIASDANGFGGPGVGAEVQGLESGQLPDAVFPNTCNG
jgi:hypothetical protein